MSAKRLLFLCTGNYYRSRFAELLFNHMAANKLDWHADSAALNLSSGSGNVGPISPLTLAALKARGVGLAPPRSPVQVTRDDLSRADLVVAVKETEHRPMLQAGFPEFADRVEYWLIHDLDAAGPEQALAEIEIEVTRLIERLAARE